MLDDEAADGIPQPGEHDGQTSQDRQSRSAQIDAE